jgi:hypothetical protein
MRVLRTPILLLSLLAGCAAPAPHSFLGVPEDRALLFEDENPGTPLRGIPKITPVRLSDHATYRSLRRSGRIVAEERRGEWLYFAIEGDLGVPVPGGPGQPGGERVVVTERFKARVADSDR